MFEDIYIQANNERDAIIRTTKRRVHSAEIKLLLEDQLQKTLHGKYFEAIRTHELSLELSRAWLRSTGLRLETEEVFGSSPGWRFTHTVVLKAHPEGGKLESITCRACENHLETLLHLLSACPT